MKRYSLAVLTFSVGVVIGSVFVGNLTHGQNAPPKPGPANARELTSYRDVVKKILPAVVSIETRAKANAAPPIGETPPRDDYGSGFLIAADGVVVTSFHIVRDAALVVVTLHDGRKFTSKDIRGDVRSDLAVIVLNTKKAALPFLELGDSDAMEIGDHVLAVGAPFGLTGSVTHGIVSGKGRDLNLNLYEDFLQTDAAINPGNSGGPLVNLEGKVVGINAAIKSKTGGFQGVGLAVASNLARGVVEALRKDGVVRRAYLGLQARDLAPEIAVRLGVPKDAGGVVVAKVFPNSPAARAGLQPGDILTKIDGRPVRDTKLLQGLVARLPLGKSVPVEFVRAGKSLMTDAPVEEQPAGYSGGAVPAPRGLPAGLGTVSVPRLGLELADLTADLARDLGYPAGTRGVIVARVEPGNVAAEAALHSGMLIAKVDGKTVGNAADARKMLETASAQGVLLQVQSLEGGVTYVLLKAD
jgi:serine protease Do